MSVNSLREDTKMKAKYLVITQFILVSLIVLSPASYALLWDFNNEAQQKDWKAISGVCEIDKDNTFMVSDNAAEALALAGDPDWTDYTITCRARLTQAGSFNNIAVAFRASEDGINEYMLMFEGGRQQAEWWKKIAGNYTEIKVDPLEIDTKGWFSIKVVVNGKSFEGYYEDEFVSSIEDSDLDKGMIGFRVYGCTSNVDDLDINGPGILPTSVEYAGKLPISWGKIRNSILF